MPTQWQLSEEFRRGLQNKKSMRVSVMRARLVNSVLYTLAIPRDIAIKTIFLRRLAARASYACIPLVTVAVFPVAAIATVNFV